MKIKINGIELSGAPGACCEKVSPFRSVSIRKAERDKQLLKYLPLGHKIVFGLATATLFVDMILGGGSFAFAASSLDGAFKPVKNLLLNIADPLCYVMAIWGCIECMVGRVGSGLSRVKYAALGYIAMNWIPVLMDVIRSSGPGA